VLHEGDCHGGFWRVKHALRRPRPLGPCRIRAGQPNFASEWIATSTIGDKEAGGFSILSGGDGLMTITQDATTLAVAWVSYGRSHKPVQSLVNLDGPERRYIDRNSVEPQERSTRARWQGTQLVITTLWAGYKGVGIEGQSDRCACLPVERGTIGGPQIGKLPKRKSNQNALFRCLAKRERTGQ